LKIKILFVLFLLGILALAYMFPTLYYASRQADVLKVAKIVVLDTYEFRRKGVKDKIYYGFLFDESIKQGPFYKVFKDTNKNLEYDNSDEVVKTVFLNSIQKGVIYSSLFNTTGLVFKNKTLIFSPDLKCSSVKKDVENSIFFISKLDEEQRYKERIVKVTVSDDCLIKLFMSTQVPNQDEDLVLFESI